MLLSVFPSLCLLLATLKCFHPVDAFSAVDLATKDSFDLSFEGSWSYLQLNPSQNTLAFGDLYYTTYSDWNPKGPLLADILSPVSSCTLLNYTWRPDFAETNALCGDQQVRSRTGYLNNGTMCTTYNKGISLHGVQTAQKSSTLSVTITNENQIIISVNFTWNYFAKATLTRYFVLQGGNFILEGNKYTVQIPDQGGAICLTELETSMIPQFPDVNDFNSTTQNVNDWLSELTPLQMDPEKEREYYSSWFQFWFNTEHDGGYWVKPVITPSMEAYARGMWLWDTAFHVFALLEGGRGKKRSLTKAQNNLEVLINLGIAQDHVPRVVGIHTIEKTTQPPGILTWAAMVIYNQTGDTGFLSRAFEAFSKNNEWYYKNRASSNGLGAWKGADSGWDTSPRWDNGDVEAIDLNAWLYIDQVFLSKMAAELGNRTKSEYWHSRAEQTKNLTRMYLWDPEVGVFWDRLPKTGEFQKIVTPASFWAMLANIATPEQASAMVKALFTPDRLQTKFPMPVVGVKEKVFDPNNYWRGPVWINVNWLSSLGMQCYGMNDLAKTIQETSTLEIGVEPDPREYYNPLDGHGLGAKNFMWTGALNIVILNDLQSGSLASSMLFSALNCSHNQ